MDEAQPGEQAEAFYPILVTVEKRRVTATVPELAVVSVADTVEAAVAEAARKRDDTLSAYKAAELSPPRPRDPERLRGGGQGPGASGVVLLRRPSWTRLAAGLAAVAAVGLVVAVTVGIMSVQRGLSRAAASLEERFDVSILRKVEEELLEAASPENNIPPEKVAAIAASLRTLAMRVRPFVDALAPLYQEDFRTLEYGSIELVSATYGANCGAAASNVTQHVAAMCDGKSICNYEVSARKLGDPSPGCAKDYRVTWRCGADDQRERALVLEPEAGLGGKSALLSCVRTAPSAGRAGGGAG